jgi:hypothetical protein
MDYNINSPAAQSDFNQILKSNPDIYTVIDWLVNNINLDQIIDPVAIPPECIYSDDDLGKWAKSNGYTKE